VWPYADKTLEIIKPMIVKVYDNVVDGQQIKLINAYTKKGLPAASKLFDEAQKRTFILVQRASIVPQKWRDTACVIIEDEGNKFQAKLYDIAAKEGAAGINKLIDATQANIRGRILAL